MTGNAYILASSANCRLITSDGSTKYLLYTLTNTANTSLASSNVDLTSLLSANTATTGWQVSDDCTKIVGKNLVYATVSGSMSQVYSNSSLISFDSSLTYGITSGQILKYNTTSKAYNAIYSSLNSSFTAGSIIKSYSNRIVVYKVSSTSVLLDVFVDNNNAVTNITSTTSYTFTSSPKVSLSSQLTKILIYGVNGATTTSLKANLFFVNYTSKSIQTLTFPTETVLDPANFIALVE